MQEDGSAPRGVVILRVGDLVGSVQNAVRWASRAGWSVGRRLPGAGLLEREVRRAERHARRLGKAATGELARGVAAINDTLAERMATSADVTARRRSAARDSRASLRAGMAELLDRALESDVERSRQYLFGGILRRLVPDEARILAALSDGTAFPLIDVVTRGGLGGGGRVTLRNASTVGKSAGITLVDSVPTYVSRLLELGLVEIGPEEPSLDVEYDVLRTDPVVREGEEQARRMAKLAPRVVRRSLRISSFGKEFWAACDPTASGEGTSSIPGRPEFGADTTDRSVADRVAREHTQDARGAGVGRPGTPPETEA